MPDSLRLLKRVFIMLKILRRFYLSAFVVLISFVVLIVALVGHQFLLQHLREFEDDKMPTIAVRNLTASVPDSAAEVQRVRCIFPPATSISYRIAKAYPGVGINRWTESEDPEFWIVADIYRDDRIAKLSKFKPDVALEFPFVDIPCGTELSMYVEEKEGRWFATFRHVDVMISVLKPSGAIK